MSVRVAIFFPRRLDAEQLGALVESDAAFCVVGVWSCSFLETTRSSRFEADILLIDGQLPQACPITLANELFAMGKLKAALLLDREFSVTRARRCLQAERISYLSRSCSRRDVLQALRFLAAGKSLIENALPPDSRLSRRSAIKTLRRFDRHGVLSLTEREIQIMQFISLGRDMRDAARSLGISRSTVDNHRSRLKKKLNVSKAVEVARIAIKEGIVDVHEPCDLPAGDRSAASP